jgi:hypothetical protein
VSAGLSVLVVVAEVVVEAVAVVEVDVAVARSVETYGTTDISKNV